LALVDRLLGRERLNFQILAGALGNSVDEPFDGTRVPILADSVVAGLKRKLLAVKNPICPVPARRSR